MTILALDECDARLSRERVRLESLGRANESGYLDTQIRRKRDLVAALELTRRELAADVASTPAQRGAPAFTSMTAAGEVLSTYETTQRPAPPPDDDTDAPEPDPDEEPEDDDDDDTTDATKGNKMSSGYQRLSAKAITELALDRGNRGTPMGRPPSARDFVIERSGLPREVAAHLGDDALAKVALGFHAATSRGIR